MAAKPAAATSAVNLILLDAGEISTAGRATLHGDRAQHIVEVLGATTGRILRIGIIDGPCGQAEVEQTTPTSVILRCEFDAQPPARPQDTLLLAVPRPIVLRRVLEHATAIGFGRIVLFRSKLVDRSHLDSRTVQPEKIRQHLLLGMAQSRRTHLPRVLVYPRFKPFVEDQLDGLIPSCNRYLADPEAKATIHQQPPSSGPFSVAIGPERGFTDYEVEQLGAYGFCAINAGPHPLRVETAVVAMHARLDTMRSHQADTHQHHDSQLP